MKGKHKRGSAEMVHAVLGSLAGGPCVMYRIQRASACNFYCLRDIVDGLCIAGLMSYAEVGLRRKYFLTPEGKDFYRLLDSCLCVVEACLV